jgi:hypothetical protein
LNHKVQNLNQSPQLLILILQKSRWLQGYDTFNGCLDQPIF